MSERRDYYKLQVVTHAELDSGFDGLENADLAQAVDQDLAARATSLQDGGIFSGLVASNPAALNIQVTAGVGYDDNGRRCATGSVLTVDISQTGNTAVGAGGTPAGGVSTAPGSGNERWVSLFLVYARILQDHRVDGDGNTVYFERLESFRFNVAMGAAAVTPTDKAALASGKLLLGDFRITHAGTVAEINLARRQNWFRRVTGVAPTARVGSGYVNRGVDSGLGVRDVLASLLGYYNDHVDGTADKHTSDDLVFAGSANWADATGLSALEVQAAINEIVSDLAASAGAGRVGAAASSNWIDGTPNPADDIQGRINALITQLGASTTGASRLSASDVGPWHDTTNVSPATKSIQNMLAGAVSALASATGNGGADKVGAGAQSSGGESVVAGSIWDQVGQLLSSLNGKGALANSNIWTAALNTFNQRLNVGSGLIGSSGNAELARLATSAASYATSVYTLLWTFGSVSVYRPQLRLYARVTPTNSAYLVITQNAQWVSGQWLADTGAGGDPAYRWSFSDAVDNNAPFTINRRTATTTPWGEATWESLLGLDHTVGLYLQSAMAVRPGTTDIAYGTTPEANSLYSKNIVKAWGYLETSGGIIANIEGFNINPTISGNDILVTFHRNMQSARYAVSCTNMGLTANFVAATNDNNTRFFLRMYDTSGSQVSFATTAQKISFVVLARQ